jgi:hypothetical protein
LQSDVIRLKGNNVLDSAASGNYFKASDSKQFTEAKPDRSHVITTPTGQTIRSIQTAKIANNYIPVVIFEDKDLPDLNLVTVPLLCQNGMEATFSKNGAIVSNSAGQCVIRAHRDIISNLYILDRKSVV